MTADASPAITRFDFPSGLLRGTYFTLYSSALVHRGEQLLENFPLAGIASLLLYGIGIGITPVCLFAMPSTILGSRRAGPGAFGSGRLS